MALSSSGIQRHTGPQSERPGAGTKDRVIVVERDDK